MTRVLILGQPLWGVHVAQALNTGAADVRATFIPSAKYAMLLAAPLRSERVVIMRAGYRVGASTARGRLFDAYWSLLRRSQPNAVPCHYWLGSDVLDTVEEAQAGTLRSAALASSHDDVHLAGAPWLIPELETVGLHSTLAYMPAKTRAPRKATSLPSEFSVLTYLPTERFEFYGGPTIFETARRLPDIWFDVVGSRGAPANLAAPPNIRWHGWVSDMTSRYAETTVVVRIPRHDGGAGTMTEGLLHGRHVIYIHEFPFVRKLAPVTPEALVIAIEEFHAAHASGRLGPNLGGRAFALKEFDEATLVERMKALLRARE